MSGTTDDDDPYSSGAPPGMPAFPNGSEAYGSGPNAYGAPEPKAAPQPGPSSGFADMLKRTRTADYSVDPRMDVSMSGPPQAYRMKGRYGATTPQRRVNPNIDRAMPNSARQEPGSDREI